MEAGRWDRLPCRIRSGRRGIAMRRGSRFRSAPCLGSPGSPAGLPRRKNREGAHHTGPGAAVDNPRRGKCIAPNRPAGRRVRIRTLAARRGHRGTPPASAPGPAGAAAAVPRSEEHTSELQSHSDLVCRLLLEKKKKKKKTTTTNKPATTEQLVY